MENKRIIGYKLKDHKYNQAAMAICGVNTWGTSDRDYHRTHEVLAPGSYPSLLKDAGVLDIWFTPVYEYDTFEINDVVCVLPNGDRDHNSSHHWHKIGHSVSDGELYQIEDVDITPGIDNTYTIRINDTAVRSRAVRHASTSEITKFNEITTGDYFVCKDRIVGYEGEKDKVYLCSKRTPDLIFFAKYRAIAPDRCRKATPKEIKNCAVIIGGHELESNKPGIAKFGCLEISSGQLASIRSVLQLHAYLLPEFNLLSELTRGNVNEKLIEKILSRLK